MHVQTLRVKPDPLFQAFIFDGTVEGNYVVTHTSRGAQQGVWCEEKNDEHFSMGARSHWRRYTIEDIVPPASRQLVSVHFSVNLADWDLDVLFAKVTLAPRSLVGHRPKHHPFAPHGIQSSLNCAMAGTGYKDPASSDVTHLTPLTHLAHFKPETEDLELQLALALSLDSCPSGGRGEARSSEDISGRRWARREKRQNLCAICVENVPSAETLPCCGKACESCARHWAVEQESQGFALDEISCPFCARSLASVNTSLLATFLGKDALDRSQQRVQLREAHLEKGPSSLSKLSPILSSRILIRLGLKQCPGCGEGMQKESETCHKMICRSCRARFCFRCLARLEYFNCGCTGAEHNFVDPLDGSTRSHQ